MSRYRLAVMALGVFAVFHARPVDAQHRWRGRVSVDAGVQASPIAFDESTTKTVHLESSVVDTAYNVTTGPQVNGSVTIRLAGNLGIGVAVSSFVKKNDAAITATIPHPFFYNTPRSIAGTASGLERNELVAHLQAVYVILPNGRVDVALSGGPSFFSVKQALVTDVSYRDTYPYDTPTFTAASSATVSRKAVGFNVGADVAVRLTRHVGVGGLVRLSRASLVFPVPGSTVTVKSDVGGIQASGGIRLFF
jgi:hypothetical protein